MAEKHGDKVKKGFLFYVFMLLMILVAAFLIIVMIMLFMPGKAILGFKYFNFDKEIVQTKTTDNGTDISFDQINQIVVNTSYANVKVTKATKEDSVDSIKITNGAKGFAKDSYFTDFEYSAVLSEDGKSLTVNVKEPEAFLYFSRKISVEISISYSSTLNFANTSFVINTQAGDVTIGNADNDETQFNLNIRDLSVTTTSGDITITKENGNEVTEEQEQRGEIAQINFNSLTLCTSSGHVKAGKNLSIKENPKFSILKNGKMTFCDIEADKVQLVINDGSFSVVNIGSSLGGTVSVTSLTNGSIDIFNIQGVGSVFETNHAENIGKAKIYIDSVGSISIPFGNKADITVGDIRGVSLIRTTSGNITVTGGPQSDLDYKTVSGNVDITFNEKWAFGYNRNIESQNGNVTLRFKDRVRNITTVRTNGNVNIVLPGEVRAFTLVLNTYDGEPITELNKNISIPFIDNQIYQYPFKVNYPTSTFPGLDNEYAQNQVIINSNGKIKVTL